jgi:excisionase family DNA binding protein
MIRVTRAEAPRTAAPTNNLRGSSGSLPMYAMARPAMGSPNPQWGKDRHVDGISLQASRWAPRTYPGLTPLNGRAAVGLVRCAHPVHLVEVSDHYPTGTWPLSSHRRGRGNWADPSCRGTGAGDSSRSRGTGLWARRACPQGVSAQRRDASRRASRQWLPHGLGAGVAWQGQAPDSRGDDGGEGRSAIEHGRARRAYVGATKAGFWSRWEWHRSFLRVGTHANHPLPRDWLADGPGWFKFVVCEDLPQEMAFALYEQAWMDRLRGCSVTLDNRQPASEGHLRAPKRVDPPTPAVVPAAHQLPTVFTLREVADQLSVSHETLYRWIRDGTIAAQKLGPQWRVHEETLRQLRGRHEDPSELLGCDESPGGTPDDT